MAAALAGVVVVCLGAMAAIAPGSSASIRSHAATSTTVWLCRPGLANDPCTSSLATTVIQATGAKSTTTASVNTASKFDCFYVYPTVSLESSLNADLKVQKTEIAAAEAQASRFSTGAGSGRPCTARSPWLGLRPIPPSRPRPR